MNFRTLVVFTIALVAASIVSAQDTGVKKSLSVNLSALVHSVADYEPIRLRVTIVNESLKPALAFKRSDVVRPKAVVAAGPDRKGRWTESAVSPIESELTLAPGESITLVLDVKIPAGVAPEGGSTMLQWVGAGALAGYRSNEFPVSIRKASNPIATVETTDGVIVLELFPERAPNHVANFMELADKGFYNGLTWHRIVREFVVQTGCPKGDGTGDPGYFIPAEFNDVPFTKGVVGMARSTEKDSAGSQWFICVADARGLDGQYTAFGRVLEGLDVAERLSTLPTKGGTEMPAVDARVRSVSVSAPPEFKRPAVRKVGDPASRPAESRPAKENG